MCATPEDPRQAFPFINVAIWKNADAYLAAFGGQAPEAGSKPRMIERDLPAPGSREVRLRVAACGVCHSDSVTVQGLLPGTYPRVPGLEVIGMVEAIGPDVAGWDVGMRVGVSVGSVVRAGTAPDAAAVNRNAYTKAAKSVVAQ